MWNIPTPSLPRNKTPPDECLVAQSTRTVEYIDCVSAEGKTNFQRASWIRHWIYLIVRLQYCTTFGAPRSRVSRKLSFCDSTKVQGWVLLYSLDCSTLPLICTLYIYIYILKVNHTHTHTHTHHTYSTTQPHIYMCVCVCVWLKIKVIVFHESKLFAIWNWFKSKIVLILGLFKMVANQTVCSRFEQRSVFRFVVVEMYKPCEIYIRICKV